MEKGYAVVSSRPIFEGRVFSVRADRVRYPDGTLHPLEIVEHGASLAILAMPSPREVVLVRQYRHAAGRELWEIPAGAAEPGESAVAGAARELREETGYIAGRIEPFGSVWMTPGFCSEQMHFFRAEDLSAGAPSLDEDERIEVATFTLDAAWRLGAAGTADAKTVLALLWLQGGEAKFGSDSGR